MGIKPQLSEPPAWFPVLSSQHINCLPYGCIIYCKSISTEKYQKGYTEKIQQVKLKSRIQCSPVTSDSYF